MNLSDFDYKLSANLIAQQPLAKRSGSRLLCLNKTNDKITHHHFKDLPTLLRPKDLIILNNTKVIPARLFAHKPTGGKVEILVERILGNNKFSAQTKSSKSLKIGTQLILNNDSYLEVTGHQDNLFELKSHSPYAAETLLKKFGHIPLPPYIKHQPNIYDKKHYQTVYAKYPGAIAAPTAGLHFDKKLLQNLVNNNIQIGYITLHVGLGTFQPIRSEKIEDHKIHPEYIEVSKTTCDKIDTTKKIGGRVVAVGTTSLRALETASLTGKIKPYQGDTNIFIYPGFNFRSTDILITNFHLPKTTLLMLVCAFAGYDNTMRAYQEAIQNHYRFYSYGDAMIVI